MIKSAYVPIHISGRWVHVATITRAWKQSDFDKLAEDYPAGIIKTARHSLPIAYFARAEYRKNIFRRKWI